MMRILPARAAVAVVYMAGVISLSALPGRSIARWGLTSVLLDLLHVPLFTGLTLVTLWALVGPRLARYAWVAAGTLAFAAADEWLQRFVPGRVASLADFGRDALGIGIGIVVAEGLRPLAIAWRRESQR